MINRNRLCSMRVVIAGLFTSLVQAGCAQLPIIELPTDSSSLVECLQTFLTDFARQVLAAWLL